MIAIKLNMSKANDRVEWALMENMLRALGFNECWIETIMSFISSVTYSILVNGKSCEQFTHMRGLR